MVGWWLFWQLTQFNNVRQQTNAGSKPLLEPEKEADTTWTLRIGYNSYLCVLKTNGRFVQRRCVPLDFSAKCCERILPLLHNVEMAGKWQSNAGTTVSFFIPKSTTSQRPIAVLPTLTIWWEWFKALGVAERKNTAISLGMRARSFLVDQKEQDGYRSQWWSHWTFEEASKVTVPRLWWWSCRRPSSCPLSGSGNCTVAFHKEYSGYSVDTLPRERGDVREEHLSSCAHRHSHLVGI